MSKKCARCEKTVYPIEELKCLDKNWHKLCFKCQVCNMTLNMKSYKGFNKQPYCEAHIPKAKATTMAETPELKRIAENTKIQSNVKYHAEFEKAKGKFTQVADDPETLRIKQNSKIISNAAYHGDLEKKKAMEEKRLQTGENGEDDGENATQHVHPTRLGEDHLGMPPPLPPPVVTEPPLPAAAPLLQHHRPPGRIADYDPIGGGPDTAGGMHNSPYSARQSQTLIYTSDRGAVTSPPTRQIGSIADLDPVNDCYGSLTSNYRPPPGSNHQANQNKAGRTTAGGKVYRAMYDYDAQDDDEVSFSDGDLIVNCTAIDEGWMTGVVQRTGQTGMLPANYVEPAL